MKYLFSLNNTFSYFKHTHILLCLEFACAQIDLVELSCLVAMGLEAALKHIQGVQMNPLTSKEKTIYIYIYFVSLIF